MDGGLEEGEIMQDVSPSVDYGMAICHDQIIIPPRDKQTENGGCMGTRVC